MIWLPSYAIVLAAVVGGAALLPDWSTFFGVTLLMFADALARATAKSIRNVRREEAVREILVPSEGQEL